MSFTYTLTLCNGSFGFVAYRNKKVRNVNWTKKDILLSLCDSWSIPVEDVSLVYGGNLGDSIENHNKTNKSCCHFKAMKYCSYMVLIIFYIYNIFVIV
jgi:hypothetical protein